MKNYIYVAVSLDGFIARKDGSVDWLMGIPNPEGSDFGFSEFMSNVDAVVLGKNTFESVLTFGEWPYTKPVFVLSSSLKQIPPDLETKAELLKGTPEKIIADLSSRNINSLYIDGGKTIQDFLKREMIDELIISHIPVILGEGIPLFAELDKMQNFEHIKTEIFNNIIVKSHYRKIVK
jgi:dihydrofolate reductase